VMSIPETTSAEGLERYVGGKCLFHSTGEAWRDVKAFIVSLPPIVDMLHVPSVSKIPPASIQKARKCRSGTH
jgi:hypothetical protein